MQSSNQFPIHRQWTIPSISNTKKDFLYHGYVRGYYGKHVSTDIIKLLQQFYNFDLYSIQDIIHCGFQENFIGPIFEINSFKFYLELWPNGCNDYNHGRVSLQFSSVSIPRNLQILIQYKLSLKETNTQFTSDIEHFHPGSLYRSWNNNLLKFDALKNLKTITVNLHIIKFHVISNKNLVPNPMTIKSAPILKPRSLSFTWMIEDAEKVKTIKNAGKVYGFASRIFKLYGLKWYIVIYPNGSKINSEYYHMFLYLASIPKYDTEIYIKQGLSVGNNVQQAVLKHDGTMNVVLSDRHFCGNKRDLAEMKRFVISVEIELINVYQTIDNQQIDVTNKYLCHAIDGNDDDQVEMEMREFVWMIDGEDLDGLQNGGWMVQCVKEFKMWDKMWSLCIDRWGFITLTLMDQLKNDDVMALRCFINVIELNVKIVMKVILDSMNYTLSCGADRILRDKFKELKQCVIKVEMELIDNIK